MVTDLPSGGPCVKSSVQTLKKFFKYVCKKDSLWEQGCSGCSNVWCTARTQFLCPNRQLSARDLTEKNYVSQSAEHSLYNRPFPPIQLSFRPEITPIVLCSKYTANRYWVLKIFMKSKRAPRTRYQDVESIFFAKCLSLLPWFLAALSWKPKKDIVRTYIPGDICPHNVRTTSPSWDIFPSWDVVRP